MDLKLPELTELERIIQAGAPWLEARSACNVEFKGRHFPVYVLNIGSKDPSAPAVGFFGGVHGLERIGTRILLAFLRSLLGRLKWDKVLHHQLESVRLVFMPLVNPAGMWNNTRCNTSGVDLMRNAPVDSLEKVPFLLGGQRFSARLPWYRGAADAPMEAEAQALCDVVREELSSRAFSVALDCHSGFGLQDLTHGDLWDYLYMQTAAETNNVFLPLTLEMGSWRWVKKNPRQLFSRTGMFNPNAPHRLQRVLRSHLVWFDFLTRAACAHKHWLPGEDGSTPVRMTGA